ncbi:rCG30792 [Rattus norvegicus]|uniref:RCG30792 n=1 Tax=Rattus norvegicus TaxID=10116 RepID=A6IU90_RAT|nr:rCG30792 [Rattus norvegicus]
MVLPMPPLPALLKHRAPFRGRKLVLCQDP